MKEYIEREAAIETVSTMALVVDERLMIIRRINTLPSADVKPVVHAHWFHEETAIWDSILTCSACGSQHACGGRMLKFCPNCGATMDESEE